MFERFSDSARRVVVLAQEESRLQQHNYIGTEHILAGLTQIDEGVAAGVLASFEITTERVRAEIVKEVGPGEKTPWGHIPFTPGAKRILELSLREALQLGHNYIGTEHVLLGLIREGEGLGAKIVARLGADLDRVRERTIEAVLDPSSRESAEDVPPLRVGTSSLVGSMLAGITQRVLELGHDRLGSEHVVLWLLDQSESGAAQAFRDQGIDVEALKTRLSERLRDAGGTADP
ncbi:MAG TPA: Clp protease N-terminal domain-containing protein [Acidimicrobiales bacterium]|jgi:ATP-dependent Clp protease ATP-binding subunit ClpA